MQRLRFTGMRAAAPSSLLALAIVAATAAPAFAEDGDAEAGERVFRQCMACHSLNDGENRVGPHLYGIFGREAGAVDGYNYTDAMRDSGVVWDADTMDSHLADTRGFIPDNRMGIMNPQGVPDAQDRADLIAYLEQATAPAE